MLIHAISRHAKTKNFHPEELGVLDISTLNEAAGKALLTLAAIAPTRKLSNRLFRLVKFKDQKDWSHWLKARADKVKGGLEDGG